MFKLNSHQHRYGSEMLTRQGFPHIHNYYCNILCYKQEVPKKKAYATLYKYVYVCDNSCLGTTLLASILNYSKRVVGRKGNGAVLLSCSQ